MNSLRIQTGQGSQSELDLQALLQAILRSRRNIAILTLLGTLIATAHTLLTPPSYQVQSILRPATVKDLDALNSTGLYRLTPEEALKRVGAALESWETRRAFLENWSSKTAAGKTGAEQALQGIAVLRPDAIKGEQFSDSVDLTLIYTAGLDGPGLVNGLVAHAIKSEQQRIVLEVKALAKNRQVQLEKKIAAARASHEASKQAHIAKLKEADNLRKAQLQDELRALHMQLKKRREDRIAQLAEAIRIAEKLEIHTPTTRSALAPTPTTTSQAASVVYTEINSQATPLYFLGTRALKAERDSLLERSSDDFAEPRIAEIMKQLQLLEHNREIELLQGRTDEEPFMKNLASWREEAAHLQQLETDLSDLRLAIVDQPALKPDKPIGPGKSSDILSGTIAGAALGVLLAIFRTVFMPSQKRGPE